MDRIMREVRKLPVQPLPKQNVEAAFFLVLQAKQILGEHYENNQQYAEALPVYHAAMAFADDMNQQGHVWVNTETMGTIRMNLGLCYKHAKLYHRAQDWYDRAAKFYLPGDTDLADNQDKLREARRGGNPPSALRVCWACGKNGTANPGIKLLACARCNAQGKAEVAHYCGAACQKADWKHHKKACHDSS